MTGAYRLTLTADEAIQRALVAEIVERVRLLERGLKVRGKGRPYLLGTQFALADVALSPWVEQLATPARSSDFQMPRKP